MNNLLTKIKRPRQSTKKLTQYTIDEVILGSNLQLTDEQNNQILTDDRVEEIIPLRSPASVIKEIPQSQKSAETVLNSRAEVKKIINSSRSEDKLLVVVGPCSIHDTKAALEYAKWLKEQRNLHQDQLEIVMRTYLEKPRTTTGWKGIVNDPNLDDSFDINKGLVVARELLQKITELGVPVSYELLSVRTPQYISDLISWGAIGARTTESQLHRELASGVSFPVGFKNSTSGNVQVVADALLAASSKHVFMGIDLEGRTSVIKTRGNPDCHTVLRGSDRGPNYDPQSVREAVETLKNGGQNTSIMIDCSHANSNKDFRGQKEVAESVAKQVKNGNRHICGVMIESNLVEGAQKLVSGKELVYGQSITDACVGLAATSQILETLAEAVKIRQTQKS